MDNKELEQMMVQEEDRREMDARMDAKDLERVTVQEQARQEMEAMLDAKVNGPTVEVEKPNILDIEANIREKEMAKDLDVEAMNRNIYADMESRMNQPSPLYDDDEMSKMLDRSNLDEVSSKEDKERGPRGL